jgi:multidrug efflux pump subunit AcrA (membrane-fusion protein)
MVARGGAPRVRFAGPPKLLADMRVSDRIEVRVEGLAAPFTARVEAVSPEIDTGARMIFAEASFDPVAGSRLRPGLVARVVPAAAAIAAIVPGEGEPGPGAGRAASAPMTAQPRTVPVQVDEPRLRP